MDTQKDIEKYAAEYTNFGFEIRVAKIFRQQNWDVQHSGTYVDPISKKNREFDLRARKAFSRLPYTVQLAVECKQISPSFPLVVQSVLRTDDEAFHDIINYAQNGYQPHVARARSFSLYKFGLGQWVGKSFDQVGRNAKNEFTASDSKVFDKMSQAINSAEALIQRSLPDGGQSKDTRHIILPVLVVPDGCLWKYDENGEMIDRPGKVTSAQYFINQAWPFEVNGISASYTMSHLEIVTFSEIATFLNNLINEDLRVHREKIFRID